MLSGRALPGSRRAVVRMLYDPHSRAPLDRAVVLWLPGPATATGEDLVELHLHGSVAVVEGVEAALAALPGIVAAGPGAFTRRAFDNGRIDLTEVEGLADLMSAETAGQRIAALAMAEGGLRRKVEQWRERLLMIAARTEAALDFSDEDDVARTPDDAMLDRLSDEVEATLAQPPAERLRDGVRVVVAGPPNVGKSTLVNVLAAREAAIVSDIAGTTRDVIEVPLRWNGVALLLIDTAGLRQTVADPVEAIGIQRASETIDRADIVVWLGPPEQAPRAAIVVHPRADLGRVEGGEGIYVSAVTGEGLVSLRAAITERVIAMIPVAGMLALSAFQRDQLAAVCDALKRAVAATDDILIAEELRCALRAFDRLSGRCDVEALLDRIFGSFCIGK